MPTSKPDSRAALIGSATELIRGQGYSATRVEDICDRAGLSKGSFFHHFATKEQLAITAADEWHKLAADMFEKAPYRLLTDPLDRLLGYIDFRKTLIDGDLSACSCLVGTMAQEVYRSHPAIREACERTMAGAITSLSADITEAMSRYSVQGEWTADSLALYTQSVLQGAFVLAKGANNPEIALECLDHLRRYVQMLFITPNPETEQ